MSAGHQQLFRNATLTVAQVVLSATFLFAIYKYLLGAIGPEQMGVWSIVMALSTVARITDLGFAGGMTRFVAKYQALDDHEAVLEVVETGTLSLAVLSVLILTLSYPMLRLGLPHVMAPGPAALALKLLPFSLASFGALAVAGAYLSTLDGLQRADLRNLILMGGTVLYGGLIPLCVWQLGFEGLGWAQLGQTLTILVVAGWTVRRRLGLGWLPRRWQRARFREMLGYNVNLQVTTIAAFLGDPLTKLLLGHFGQLSVVGYYEMATKMVSQFRAIVTNVNQIMVPVITHLHEKGEAETAILYQRTYRLLFFVCAFFYGIAAISVPVVSIIWIGHYHAYFVVVASVMFGTMFVNTLTAPAYFANIGTGRADINAISQIVIGSINAIIGSILGYIFGGAGVVAAYSVAVLAGSAFLWRKFLLSHKLPARQIIPDQGFLNSIMILVVASTSIGISFITPSVSTLLITTGASCCIASIIAIRNPVFKTLTELILRRGRPS